MIEERANPDRRDARSATRGERRKNHSYRLSLGNPFFEPAI
jgi:hypothetical protein